MRALVREIAGSFADAVTAVRPDPPIDVARARQQHAAYVAGLEWLGATVTMLEADERFPDGCFVEDCAVIAGGVALLTRPGAPSRQGEVAVAAAALQRLLECVAMAAPATLDGGDCLRIGRRIFVGRSARSNAAGAARLAEVFGPLGYRVTEVALPAGVLHLKCVCSPLGDGRVLVADGVLAPGSLGDVALVTVPPDEAYAANCVAVGGRALMAAGYPRARAAVEAAGLEVRTLEVSETRKADGALTCMSLLLGTPDGQ
ncbi:MAG: hypothetical protein IT370_04945 [Deltaproteobacteria bacterium]|nr:hypothetical protein [Deltaproteobacteria bacterium]